jgi:hypothetical protein
MMSQLTIYVLYASSILEKLQQPTCIRLDSASNVGLFGRKHKLQGNRLRKIIALMANDHFRSTFL